MMKRILQLIFLGLSLPLLAQPHSPQGAYSHAFTIMLKNETNCDSILRRNDRLSQMESRGKMLERGDRSALGAVLLNAYKSAAISQSVSLTTNLIDLGVSTIVAATTTRERWHKAAEERGRMTRKLSSGTNIDDFYYLPSSNGPMDPQNIKFKGFGMRHYLVNAQAPERSQSVLKLFCTLRTDSLGMSNIINHGKFSVDLQELWFKPLQCDTTGNVRPFDFQKRRDLQIQVKVRIYSSWLNELAEYHEQCLGHFTVTVKIDSTILNDDTVFVYDPNNANHRQHVRLEGDCFMVPRSYTGTSDGLNSSHSWGTGQYRVEMDFYESCRINDPYYKHSNSNRWNRKKWHPEWREMKRSNRSLDGARQAWGTFTRKYTEDGWVEMFTDPFSEAVTSAQTEKLSEWLQVEAPKAGGSKPNAGTQHSGNAPDNDPHPKP